MSELDDPKLHAEIVKLDAQTSHARIDCVEMVRHLPCGALALGTLSFAITLGTASFAWAPAWVPPAGVGSIDVTFQRIDNTGHRKPDGSVGPGSSLDVGLLLDVEYALTDRLSLSGGLPYIFAKYTDSAPPPPPIPYLPVDQCHCWHS